MKYFSLFSGIGGFELGIERACGLRPAEQFISERPDEGNGTSHQLVEWECVGHSEINKWACAIYRRHFSSHKNFGDATTIRTMDLPYFDILVGGFPCPSFSQAGAGQGFQDPRGKLFFEIVRILADKRPRYFLLENVKGLLGNKGGETFQKILEALSDIGYLLQWEVLDSCNYSVPQSRKRVFIVGYLGEECAGQIFPIGEDGKTFDAKKPRAYCLNAHYGHGAVKGSRTMIETARIKEGGRGQFIYDAKGISSSLTSSVGGRASTGLYEIPEVANCLTPLAYLCRGERKRVDGKAVLTSMWERRIRRLMPLEAERLQSFPDNWTAIGINEEGRETKISDTQRYVALGNAVTVNVVEAIVKKIREMV